MHEPTVTSRLWGWLAAGLAGGALLAGCGGASSTTTAGQSAPSTGSSVTAAAGSVSPQAPSATAARAKTSAGNAHVRTGSLSTTQQAYIHSIEKLAQKTKAPAEKKRLLELEESLRRGK